MHRISLIQLLVASAAAGIPIMSIFLALQSKEKWCVYFADLEIFSLTWAFRVNPYWLKIFRK